MAQEERERVGVELYSIQQQLARQQMLLEKEQDAVTSGRSLREQREVTLGQVREMYRQMQDQMKKERQQSKSKHWDFPTCIYMYFSHFSEYIYRCRLLSCM